MSGALLAFTAKRTILARLESLCAAHPDLVAMSAEAGYAYTGSQQRRSFYLGATRIGRDQGTAEYGTVGLETDVIALYARAHSDGTDVQAVEQDIETMINVVGAEFAQSPKLNGALTWIGFTSGDTDYTYSSNPEPSVTVVLRMLVTVQGYL